MVRKSRFWSTVLSVVCAIGLLVPNLALPVYAEKGETVGAVGWFEVVPIDLFEEQVAPGTRGKHGFSVRNTSSSDMSYELVFYGTDGIVPLLYKLRVNGEYITGDGEEDWMVATTAKESKRYPGVIPSGGKFDLVVEWEWPYESGNDQLDTQVGIAAPEEIFYVAVLGVDRNSDSAPVIVRTDSVQFLAPTYILPVFIFAGVLGITGYVVKKKERTNDNEKL